MEMYMMKKSLLLEIIQDSLIMGDSQYLKQAIFQRLDNLSVNGYPYDGYLACINSIQNYYKTSMDILNLEVARELFQEKGLIYTKTKDEPPAKYTDYSDMSNSLVANGCIIEGIVSNSIIGRGVKIKKGAVVKDSIIMQKSIIEEGSYVRNAILDKYVHVSENSMLAGDRINPLVIKKGLKL